MPNCPELLHRSNANAKTRGLQHESCRTLSKAYILLELVLIQSKPSVHSSINDMASNLNMGSKANPSFQITMQTYSSSPSW